MSKYIRLLRFAILPILLCILLLSYGLFVSTVSTKKAPLNNNPSISYIPFGDSFTIGLGVPEWHRLPNIMVENLAKEGINVTILENPAVSGYTVRDMIEYELPILKALKPDFITIFIGTNDNFAQTDVKTFEKDFKELLDQTQKLLVKPKKIIVITIPDYSLFPALEGEQNDVIAESIVAYNNIIKNESVKRGLLLADIYPASQNMNDDKYFISDGVHPSQAGYMLWEIVIRQKVKELLLQML